MIFISILTHKFDNLCGLFCDLEFLMAGKMRRERETRRREFVHPIPNPFDASTTQDSTGSVVIIAIIFPCSIREYQFVDKSSRRKPTYSRKWVKSVEPELSLPPLSTSPPQKSSALISKTCQLRRNLCCHGLKHWKLWVCFSIHFVC